MLAINQWTYGKWISLDQKNLFLFVEIHMPWFFLMIVLEWYSLRSLKSCLISTTRFGGLYSQGSGATIPWKVEERETWYCQRRVDREEFSIWLLDSKKCGWIKSRSSTKKTCCILRELRTIQSLLSETLKHRTVFDSELEAVFSERIENFLSIVTKIATLKSYLHPELHSPEDTNQIQGGLYKFLSNFQSVYHKLELFSDSSRYSQVRIVMFVTSIILDLLLFFL